MERYTNFGEASTSNCFSREAHINMERYKNPGETSTSRPKRRRLHNASEPDQETNCSSREAQIDEGSLRNRETERENPRRDGDLVITPGRSGTLLDLDFLDCPICCEPLDSPIFQCMNGHISCSSCVVKMHNRCPFCSIHVGLFRCRVMEKLVKAVIVPCPNAKYGCTKTFFYRKEVIHEKDCRFSPCYCPVEGCNYVGMYSDLYKHYHDNHKITCNQFGCGVSTSIWLPAMDRILVLQEYKEGPLIVVQCFWEMRGVNVNVKCIAPCVPGVGDYSFHLSYSMEENTTSFHSLKMGKIQKTSFQSPKRGFMSMPYYLMNGNTSWKITICIRRQQE